MAGLRESSPPCQEAVNNLASCSGVARRQEVDERLPLRVGVGESALGWLVVRLEPSLPTVLPRFGLSLARPVTSARHLSALRISLALKANPLTARNPSTLRYQLDPLRRRDLN